MHIPRRSDAAKDSTMTALSRSYEADERANGRAAALQRTLSTRRLRQDNTTLRRYNLHFGRCVRYILLLNLHESSGRRKLLETQR